jgi:CRISPR/Cas system-associated protein Cas10 (large subunit of type III CRISPR-Cas system)
MRLSLVMADWDSAFTVVDNLRRAFREFAVRTDKILSFKASQACRSWFDESQIDWLIR